MKRYIAHIRPRAPVLPIENVLFFNTEGKPLNSSTFAEALECISSEAGYTGFTSTQMRKAVTTMMREEKAEVT